MGDEKKIFKTWDDLADALGSTRKSLLRYRDKYEDAPRRRDLKAWHEFIWRHNLRPAHGWETEAGPHKAPVQAPTAPPVREEEHDWHGRRRVLFDLLEAVHNAYQDREINIVQYGAMGDATVRSIIMLGRVWGAEIDETGLCASWKKIIVAAAFAKNEENKRAEVDRHKAA